MDQYLSKQPIQKWRAKHLSIRIRLDLARADI